MTQAEAGSPVKDRVHLPFMFDAKPAALGKIGG